ncbi:MAG: hypothetical protein ABUL58_01440 [Steroidobacter sp.]
MNYKLLMGLFVWLLFAMPSLADESAIKAATFTLKTVTKRPWGKEYHYQGEVEVSGSYRLYDTGELTFQPSPHDRGAFPGNQDKMNLEFLITNYSAAIQLLGLESVEDSVDYVKYCEIRGIARIVVSDYIETKNNKVAKSEYETEKLSNPELKHTMWHQYTYSAKVVKVLRAEKPTLISCASLQAADQ